MKRNNSIEQFFSFLAAGGPSFILGVLLNYFLVEILGVILWAAYASVILVQISFNYLMCKQYVFKDRKNTNFKEFRDFFLIILFFRILDWVVYIGLVQGLGFYYLAVQFQNVIVFSALKFMCAARLFAQNP